MTKFQVHGVLSACKSYNFGSLQNWKFFSLILQNKHGCSTRFPPYYTQTTSNRSLLQGLNSSQFLRHHSPRMPPLAGVVTNTLLAIYRFIILVLRDRAYVSTSSGDGKMVKVVVEIISAWDTSTSDLISLTLLEAQWKNHLLKRKIDCFEFTTLSSYSQLLSTPVDEARMQEVGIHWQFLISWQQNFHHSTSISWRWECHWHRPP